MKKPRAIDEIHAIASAVMRDMLSPPVRPETTVHTCFECGHAFRGPPITCPVFKREFCSDACFEANRQQYD